MREVYAFRNELKEVLRSSSGGAFIAICQILEKVNKNNIAFYGACYDENMNVIHDRVESSKECSIFQGSKYVKSDIGKALELIKEDFKNHRFVVFSGTPCQVFAIKKLAEKNNIDMSGLFTIDIICHGAPMVKLWDDYKNWLEEKAGSKLVKYSFRYKPEGWKAYPAYAEFENFKKLINTAETSVFSKLHMYCYSINSSCFSCKFSNINRVGDVTLGDFWGIENIDKTMYEKNGVSLILVNSENGKSIINEMQSSNIFKIKKIDGDEYLKYQHNLNKCTEKPQNYKEFLEDYERYGFEYILRKYVHYGVKYKVMFFVKKIIRKTPIIKIIRKFK